MCAYVYPPVRREQYIGIAWGILFIFRLGVWRCLRINKQTSLHAFVFITHNKTPWGDCGGHINKNMRPRHQLIFLLLTALVTSVPCTAAFKVNGLYYNINNDNKTVTVTHEWNNGTGTVLNPQPNYSNLKGWLSIPSTVTNSSNKTYIVTAIDDYAFYYCQDVTGVTIPNSVKTIGRFAFYQCSAMKGVSFGNAITSIGQNAFEGCINLVGALTFPNTVTNIGRGAFEGCTGITSAELPSSLKSIDINLFTDCSSLGSVSIPNSVSTIGNAAFYRCTSLTSINIPNSVHTIGAEAFSFCSNLSIVVIGNSVSSIGKKSFLQCKNLTEITIPASVKTIGEETFKNCSNLNHLIISFTDCSIGSKVFYGCGLTQINCQFSNPSKVTFGANDVFDTSTYNNCTVTVPATAFSLFKKANVWKNFTKLSPDVWASNISLNKSSTNISIGQAETLIATVRPSNACPEVSWTTSDQAVATVDDNGTITAKSIGSAAITAKTIDGTNLSASCQVVVGIPVTSLTFEQTELSIHETDTFTIKATILPSSATNKTLWWSSSNGNVATISQTGTITALTKGITSIIATTTDGTNLSASCEITVLPHAQVTGDVNGDSVVSGADVTVLYNVLLNGDATEGNTDVNGDGIVNGADVTVLYSILLAQ